MKRSVVGSAASLVLAAAASAACGPAEIAVRVEVSGQDGGEPMGVAEVEIQLLPYDRDHVFDSLARAFPTPEPEVPPDLAAAQEEIAEAQRVWRNAETRWNTLRDELQRLNDRMEGLNRSTREYRELFSEHRGKYAEYEQLERRVGSLFDRFQTLQGAAVGRLDSMSVARSNWADEAFMDVDEVIALKIDVSGLDMHADTTGAEGWTLFEVPPGAYWVHARHELPSVEWYWNLAVEVARGEPVELRLSGENAEARPIF